METHNPQTPDQRIQTATYWLAAILGAVTGVILTSFGVAPSHSSLPSLIGVIAGLIIATLVIRLKPRHEMATGIWKRFDDFMLEQLNLETAFRRKR